MKHPNWVVLQITERCNLRCKMCYEWGENGAYKSRENLHDLSIGKIEEVFSDLKEYSVYYELFGGEPLLHPQFSEIMQLVKKYECKIDIPTNGTLLSKYSKEIVDAKVRRIWISLDGPEQINDLQRGKGVYKKATEGIKTIQEYKRLKNSTYPLIGVTFVLTPLNYMYLKDFVVNELLKLNLDYISIEFQLYLTPERYDKYLVYLSEKLNVESETVASGLIRDISDFNNIDLDILNKDLCEVRRIIKENGVKRIGYPHYIDTENLNYFYSGKWDLMKESKSYCPFPWVYMEVAANGDVTPCHTFYDFKMGNIYSNRILEIWNSINYSNFRKTTRKEITPLCCACSRYYNLPEDK